MNHLGNIVCGPLRFHGRFAKSVARIHAPLAHTHSRKSPWSSCGRAKSFSLERPKWRKSARPLGNGPMSTFGPTRTSRHVRFCAAVGGQADISERWRS
jgi:hypothetical protein